MSSNSTAVAQSNSFGGWDLNSFENDPLTKTQLFSLLYCLSLVIVLWIGSRAIVLWKIYHLSTPGVAIIVGALLSVMTSTYGYKDIANSFDANFFFLFLLPPLIFQAGFDQERSHFFSNWFAITVFANIGTCISTLVFGYGLYYAGSLNFSLNISLMECLAFGALISSTDPVSTLAVFADLKVDPSLSAIVYGASTLDDAVSIILYKIFLSILAKKRMSVNVGLGATVYLFVSLLASVTVGALIGGIAAYLYKLTKIRKNKNMIACYAIPLVYISYLSCSVMELSGIISCMFAAISFRYCLEIGGIISTSDKESLLLNLSVFSRFIETFVFFCIGMSMARRLMSSSKHIDAKFVFWSILLTILSRAAQIYPLSYCTNVFNGAMKFYCCYSPSETVTPSEDGFSNNIDNVMDGASSDDGSTTSKSSKPLYINMNAQHILMLAGLRGPIAYAAAEMFPQNLGSADNIYFATSFIVLTNLFINGALTQAAIDLLGIERERDEYGINKSLTAPCTDHPSTVNKIGSNYMLNNTINPKNDRRKDDSDEGESRENSSNEFEYTSNPGSIRNSSDKMNYPIPDLTSDVDREDELGSPLDMESGILSSCHRHKSPSSSSSGDSKHSEPSEFSESGSAIIYMDEILPLHEKQKVTYRGEEKLNISRIAADKSSNELDSPRSEDNSHRARYKAGKGVFSRWFKLFEVNVIVPIYMLRHPPPPSPVEVLVFPKPVRKNSSQSNNAIAVI